MSPTVNIVRTSPFPRFAKVLVDRNFIENENDLVLKAFFELKLTIIRAEILYHRDAVEYYVASPNLPEIPQGFSLPEYNIIVKAFDRPEGIIYEFSLSENCNNSFWFPLKEIVYPLENL